MHAVVGTTGFSDADLDHFEARFAASDANCVIAPNFAIGAVLMMRFAELAAPYFETAEVIELHHDEKVDAPSGTAMLTAARMAEASDDLGAPIPPRRRWSRARAAARAPAGSGCTPCACGASSRTRRSCSAPRGSRSRSATTPTTASSFMPGVLLAVRAVREKPGLTIGLDALLGL